MARRVKRSDPSLETQSTGFSEAPQTMFGNGPDAVEPERIQRTLETARSTGMLENKTARISGRISPALIAQAKRRTGLTSDSELIEFALASLALDDDFAAVFRRVHGTVDADIPLGY